MLTPLVLTFEHVESTTFESTDIRSRIAEDVLSVSKLELSDVEPALTCFHSFLSWTF